MVHQLVQDDKPLAYILGTQPFHPLPVPLLVRPPTLIPRPETEHWLAHLASLFLLSPSSPSLPKPPLTFLDLGTGTGCIPLALTHALSPSYSIRAVGLDATPTAVLLASQNAQRCHLSKSVKIVQGDLFKKAFLKRVKSAAKLSEGSRFDLVVSNPPYITRADYENLPKSVRAWEDRRALVGELDEKRVLADGRDEGLVFYERIASLVPRLIDLDPEKGMELPVMALEVGSGQAQAVAARLREARLRTDVVEDQSNYNNNNNNGGVGVGATADPAQYGNPSSAYDSNGNVDGFGQRGTNPSGNLGGNNYSNNTSSLGGNGTESSFNRASDTGNSTSAYGQAQSVGADGSYGSSGQPSFADRSGALGSNSSNNNSSSFGGATDAGNSTSAYGQSQAIGADGAYGSSGQPSFEDKSGALGSGTGYAGGDQQGANDAQVAGGPGNMTNVSRTGEDRQGSQDAQVAGGPTATGPQVDSCSTNQSSTNTSSQSGITGDDSTPVTDAGSVGEDGYPEQKHAGKVGYGPNYHQGPTTSDKLSGMKDIVKGKITKNPELVEEGKLRKTGELQEKKQAEDDANDPFAKEKEGQQAQGGEGGLSQGQRDAAATASTNSNI
ncbi:hypothetical protein RQP46_001636 [Phenoliferia psychrophenolica]